jgi:hypothetical protein
MSVLVIGTLTDISQEQAMMENVTHLVKIEDAQMDRNAKKLQYARTITPVIFAMIWNVKSAQITSQGTA